MSKTKDMKRVADLGIGVVVSYEQMFKECLTGRYLTDFLQSLPADVRHALEGYIVKRLAEVDPGYVPVKREQ